jgi:hypothetical protein
MAKKNNTYSVHCVIAFLAIAFPLIVAFIKEDDKPDLTGIVISNEKPVFSSSSWFDGSYQAARDDYSSDHWAFKEMTVRLNNQLYYEAFNQIRVNGFVMGKENYVFSENYIFAAYGDDLIKEEKIKIQMEKARVVRDSLKRKGIDLVIMFAPGKGTFCPDFISDKYKHPVKVTNYDLYKKHAGLNGLDVMDLTSYFQKIKKASPYPLFTRFGHHWSFYAECVAVDVMIKYIEALRKTDLPDILWGEVDLVDTSRSRDADVLKSMNLYKDPPQNMKLAYPQVKFEDDSSKNKTRVLVIGDSYWYGPVYMGVPQNCMAKGEFWYYYNRVVPTRKVGEKLEVWELDLKTEIEKNQVIVLEYSDGNLPGFGNGFIEDAYELYTSPKTFYARKEINRQVQAYAKQIREIPALLKKSTQKSNDLAIELDSAIRLDAMRMAGLIAR